MQARSKIVFIVFFMASGCHSAVIHGARNAGILPYTIKNGTVYFLLGLERRNHLWQWADFGGICDAEDTTDAAKYNTTQARLCAAREAAEETRYVFGNSLPLPQGLTKKSPQFNVSVKYWLSTIKKEFQSPHYFQFFAEVDYIDANSLKNSPTVDYEKVDYLWIDALHFLQAVQNKAADGFYRLPLAHLPSTVLFEKLANTLKQSDVQDFIKQLLPIPQLLATLQTLQQQLKELHAKLPMGTGKFQNSLAM